MKIPLLNYQFSGHLTIHDISNRFRCVDAIKVPRLCILNMAHFLPH